jgi:hypothetical protein
LILPKRRTVRSTLCFVHAGGGRLAVRPPDREAVLPPLDPERHPDFSVLAPKPRRLGHDSREIATWQRGAGEYDRQHPSP